LNGELKIVKAVAKKEVIAETKEAKKKVITTTKEVSLHVKTLRAELDTARLGYARSKRELNRKYASDILDKNHLKE